MKKLKLTGLLTLLIVSLVVILCFNAGSEPSIYTKFDSRSGVLYISGKGELKDMYDLEWSDDDCFSDCEHGADELCGECLQYEIEHIVIGEGITSIDHCFFNLYNLKTLSLPTTLKEIKGGSFIACNEIRSFTLPESVTVIDNAFNECTSLEWVNIPKKVKTLCGFGGARLSHIEIPRTVKKLALWSDTVDKIYIPETVTEKMLKVSGRINGYSDLDYKENLFTGLKITSPDFTVIGYDKSAAKKWAKNQKGCEFEQISPVPEKLKVKNNNTNVKLTWDAVERTESWTLYKKLKGDKKWTKLATLSGSKTSYTDKAVKWGNTYQYRLKGDSNKIYADATIGRVNSPYNLSMYATSSTTATLKWQKIDGAKYYYVYKKVMNSKGEIVNKKIAKVDAKKNYYKLTGFTADNGTVYKYCVRAHDGTSYSAYSEVIDFCAGDIEIKSCKIDKKNNTLTFKWIPSKNIKKIDFKVNFYGHKGYNEKAKETVTVKASKFKKSGKYNYVTIKFKTKLDDEAIGRLEIIGNVEYNEIINSNKRPFCGSIRNYQIYL